MKSNSILFRTTIVKVKSIQIKMWHIFCTIENSLPSCNSVYIAFLCNILRPVDPGLTKDPTHHSLECGLYCPVLMGQSHKIFSILSNNARYVFSPGDERLMFFYFFNAPPFLFCDKIVCPFSV